MDSIKSLADNFSKAWKSRDYEASRRSLEDVPSYLQNLSKHDGERALDILFNENSGILKFLNFVLHNAAKNEIENFKSSTKQAFLVIDKIIDSFCEAFEPFALKTKDLCFSCMKSSCWYYTRKAACETLQKIIQSYNQELQLDEIVTFFHETYPRVYSRKDASIYYIVIGAIAKYKPKNTAIKEYSDYIFTTIFQDFQFQCTSEKQSDEVKIYLNCFMDLFQNFTPFEGNPTKTEDYFKDLFPYLSKLCISTKIHKTVRSKAIYLCSTYMKLFSTFICNKYEQWHKIFNKLVRESGNYTHIGALRAFYKIVAEHLNNYHDSKMLNYFKGYLMFNINNQSSSYHEQRLLIYALGELSICTNFFSQTEKSEIYEILALQTLPYYTKEYEVSNNDLELLLDYYKTLTQILKYIKYVTSYQLNVITELSSYIIKQFPTLSTKTKDYTINTMKKAIENIYDLQESLKQTIFSVIFQEGIFYSCSQTLWVDVEMIQEDENIQRRPYCYKDYLPFWTSLFKIEDQQPRHLSTYIVNDFLFFLKKFIDKLNLNVKQVEIDNFSTTSFSLEAENESDFLFFINLVDLCVELLNYIDTSVMFDVAEEFIVNLIHLSYEHPRVSGFYKIIRIIFKKPDIFIEGEELFSKNTYELLVKYLFDLVELGQEYFGELQLSILKLILDMPKMFVKDLFVETLPVFKTVYTIGLADLPLAFHALDSLEKWIKHLDYQCPSDFLKAIMHQLEPYLTSKESTEECFEDNQKVQWTIYENTEENKRLEDFQNQILLLYGSFQANIAFNYIHDKASMTNASWSKKDVIVNDLLFPNLRVAINFDSLLPRIIQLTRSGDLKIKTAACEMYHTFLTVILGKKLLEPCFNKKLCLTLLQLGCDPNDAVRTLFNAFILQLTHYLSSEVMKDSRVPQDFVDRLFEGLMDKSDAAMKDCCGLYLKEFAQWSIRQAVDNDFSVIRTIVRRITNFALYPSNEQKIAAAIAFNNLHKILSENLHIVNVYWLEFLHAFVKSLEERDDNYDDVQTSDALRRVEQVIRTRSSIFIAKCDDRRKPPGFADETINGILVWLFAQCGSTSVNCRRSCMDLFEKLLPLACNSEAIANIGENEINAIALKNLDAELKVIKLRDAKDFLRALEFYDWILKKNLLSLDVNSFILTLTNEKSAFFHHLKKIVSIILHQNVRATTTTFTNSVKETEEIMDLVNEIIQGIISLFSTILTQSLDDYTYISWNDDLYSFLIHCAIYPSTVELSAKKLEISSKFFKDLENLLKLMNVKLSQEQLQNFNSVFQNIAESDIKRFDNISNIVNQEEDLITLKSFVMGFQILRRYFDTEYNITSNYLKRKLNHIFEELKTNIMGHESCAQLDKLLSVYLNALIRFFLEGCEPDIIYFLIEIFQNDNQLCGPHGSNIDHGVYFLQTFKEPVFECLLKNLSETMKIIEGFLTTSADKMFYILEELLMFAQRHNDASSEALADEIIRRCRLFLNYHNDIRKRRLVLLRIFKKAVMLKKNPVDATKVDRPSNDFYKWIIQQLVEKKKFHKITSFLQNFLPCLTSEESDHDDQLVSILSLLGSEVSSKLLNSSDESIKFQAASYFKVLLKLLVVTKSSSVYEGTIKYAIKVQSVLLEENAKEFIELYFKSISDASGLESLKIVYDIFMQADNDKEQLYTLKYFLVPSLDSSNPSVVKQFYEMKSNEMLRCVRTNVKIWPSVAEDRRKLIVKQIGCYNIFELTLAKISIDFETVVDPLGRESPRKLNQLLMSQTIELRSFVALAGTEKELTRLLHCAALNCCIAILSLKEEEKFYRYCFQGKTNDIILWDRIVDEERQYKLDQAPSEIRKERKRLVNIRQASRSRPDDQATTGNSINSCFRRYDLSTLTLLEDVHAYDLNDVRVLTQKVSSRPESEQPRLDLSFENDDLNNHECMPMIVGVFTHLYNSDIMSLPSDVEPELPGFLRVFRNGFSSKSINSRLFLMRIICNVKNVFLPYMRDFFGPLVEAVVQHLEEHRLNYVIRDILVLFIEAQSQTQDPKYGNDALRLINSLIPQLTEDNNSVTTYNLEIFESLCRLWKDHLTIYPDKLTSVISKHPAIAIRAIVSMLRAEIKFNLIQSRAVVEFIKTSANNFSALEASVKSSFEAAGYLLRLTVNNARCDALIKQLASLLARIEKFNRDRCVKCVCALYQGCRSEAKCQNFFQFAQLSRQVEPESKARCLELFLQRLSDIDKDSLPSQLILNDVKPILREPVLGCETVGLKIVARLVQLLPEQDLKPYLEIVVANFTCGESRQSLLEHRRLAYELLAKAYVCCTDSTAELCARALAQALVDPADELRQLARDFWHETANLPETCHERLLAILDYYDPKHCDSFARILCILMLELTNKSIYNKEVMFRPLVKDCQFREYELLIPHRRRNLGTMAPLFAPSLASQANRFSMMNTQAAGTQIGSLRLVATNQSSFGPSVEFAMPDDLRFRTKTLPDPFKVELSKRLASREVIASTSSYVDYQQIVGKKRNEHVEKLRKEAETRRKTAKTYRKYRIGDYPDVEITHATFVETLKQVILRDWLTCKNFIVTLIRHLLEHLQADQNKYNNFKNRLGSFFKRVLKEKDEKNSFVPIVLEIICQTKALSLSNRCVDRISKRMDLGALGIIFLEEENVNPLDDSSDEEEEEEDKAPSRKRKRLDPLNKDTWIHLAKLYKSMGMTDVVTSIVRRTDLFGPDMQEAALAQLERKWESSANAYKIACYKASLNSEKELCLDGEFECFARLSDWNQLNDRTKSLLDDDYNNVWQSQRRSQLLPRILEGQLQAALAEFSDDRASDNAASFLNCFNNWMQNREAEIKRDYGEELAMFLLCSGDAGDVTGAEARARCALDYSLEQVREHWMRLSPLAENQRFNAFLKLRAINDVFNYVKTIKASDLESSARDLSNYWQQNSPCLEDDLLPWQKLVYYRLSFAKLLHEKLQYSEDSSVQNELVMAGVKQRLKISDLAIRDENHKVLNHHLKSVVNVFDDDYQKEYPHIYTDFNLKASEYKLVKAKTTTASKKKIDYYVSSWDVALELKKDITEESPKYIDTELHLFELSSSLARSAENDPAIVKILSKNEFVCNLLNTNDPQELVTRLNAYSFERIKDACKVKSKDKAGDNYASFGKYCYDVLQRSDEEDGFKETITNYFIAYTLKGMAEGSSEAANYFPCLLKEEFYEENEEARQLFVSNCENVPSWIFLRWQAQIMSYLTLPCLTDLLIPIVERLVNDYPNGIRFTFNQVYNSEYILRMNATISDMHQRLFANKKMTLFIEAIHLVCHPEIYLKHHLQKIFHTENDFDFKEEYETLMNKVYENKDLQGPLYNLLNKYRADVESLENLRGDSLRAEISSLLQRLNESLNKRLDNSRALALQLQNYSKYLNNFSSEDIEIELTNHYDGRKKPLPQHSVKIVKMDPYVQIMKSKCSPIRLTMIGNNAKKYSYLVKFGEDLRQDQRLQQAFETINKTLDTNPNCRQRYLSINTYQVVPLSTSLGLIQWVDGTKSLREFIEFSMTDKNVLDNLIREYQYWISKASKSEKVTMQYRDAVVKYSTEVVIKQMKMLIGQVDQDYLRRTFVALSDSAECFVTLRHNFITSYATMCTAHWLTGIGDRHLDNMLIEVKTGKCYGIDFGAAFGAGINQSVPELVPFRLTNQILGLFRPFDETALFGLTMTHALAALRKEQAPLLTCLDLFVHEPIDCIKRAYKDASASCDQDNTSDYKLSAEMKIDIVRKKLNGVKPTLIMMEELSYIFSQVDLADQDVFSKFKKIIDGQCHSSRSKVKNDSLIPEEQVHCLLDQAKDLDLLGRMYAGWMPFV